MLSVNSYFEYLPIELHEKILSFLTGESLLSASKVCRIWSTVAVRIAKNQCQKTVPSECIHEISHELCSSEDLWLVLANYQYKQQLLLNKLLTFKTYFKLQAIGCVKVCCASYGSLFFLSIDNIISIYDVDYTSTPGFTFKCDGGPIEHILIIPKLKILMVLGELLLVYNIQDPGIKVNYLKKLNIIMENHTTYLEKWKRISVDGSILAAQIDNFTIIVFRISVKDDNVIFNILNNSKYPNKIFQFSIWDSEIIVLLETGDIMKWTVTSPDYLHCGAYQEIRYRNPVWMFRGRIFCSTMTSRVLLGLWHLEAGTSYWLIGKPDSVLVRCYNLDPLIENNIDEICSMCLKQRLLVCGTKRGKLIIYYLSEKYFGQDSSNDAENLDIEFDRSPDFMTVVCDTPIDDVIVEFTEKIIYILVRSKKNVVLLTSHCVKSTKDYMGT